MGGAEWLRRGCCRTFDRGRAIVGVCGAPFKCPPAPSEAALLLHDHLTEQGRPRRLRDLLRPPAPQPGAAVPRDLRGAARAPSPSATSPSCRDKRIASLDAGARRRRARRRHRAPLRPLPRGAQAPRARRGDRERDGRGRLRPGRLADPGDELSRRLRGRRRRHRRGAEGRGLRRGRRAGARRVADRPACAAASSRRGYEGQGSCYIEFGGGRVGRVDVDFLSGPKPTGTYQAPSGELVAEKQDFGASRASRWFGR